MSQARIYTTKGPVRKDGLKCGKCGDPIRKGIDRRITFAVGFRGYEQTRCLKPECYPTRSERESSAVASVYDAIDSIDVSNIDTAEDFTSARDEIVSAIEEVVSEYEYNEMIEVNYDLQERRDMLQSAADELSSWEPEGDEPEEEVDCDECGGSGQVTNDEGEDEDCDECGGTGTVENPESHEDWVDATREAFQEAIDGLELP